MDKKSNINAINKKKTKIGKVKTLANLTNYQLTSAPDSDPSIKAFIKAIVFSLRATKSASLLVK